MISEETNNRTMTLEEAKDRAITIVQNLMNAAGAEFEDENLAINIIASELDNCGSQTGQPDEEQRSIRNSEIIAGFMDHCKEEGLTIPDKYFESYFNA